ncbi:MAG TPA: hypothetical protein VE869_12595 [Gemmatimonas sp.]|nr:hypothetical protein [Gemmatimonas sp.]
MSHDPLATYLNDHLAGSVMAIGLMESLEEAYGDSPSTREIANMVRDVRHEVEEDRDVLERLMTRAGTSESSIRKTAGWFAERFAQAKMDADDSGDGAFRLLESTEVVALGILGKRGLWRALQTATDLIPATRGMNFDALIARAEFQHERMDIIRLGAARAALGDTAK